MEKKNQNTNKKIIQTSNKQVHQMRDTRTKNASQKRSKKHRKKQVFGRQSIFAGGFCIVATLAIVIGIFVSNKTKTPYEKQVITLYEKENESLAQEILFLIQRIVMLQCMIMIRQLRRFRQ